MIACDCRLAHRKMLELKLLDASKRGNEIKKGISSDGVPSMPVFSARVVLLEGGVSHCGSGVQAPRPAVVRSVDPDSFIKQPRLWDTSEIPRARMADKRASELAVEAIQYLEKEEHDVGGFSSRPVRAMLTSNRKAQRYCARLSNSLRTIQRSRRLSYYSRGAIAFLSYEPYV